MRRWLAAVYRVRKQLGTRLLERTSVMFGKKDRGSVARETRRSRGWGPFSGGQLTVIVVTFAALLLFPMGAWAVSFTNVAITDPGGVNRAKVDSSGNVQTKANGTTAVFGAVSAAVVYPTQAIYHTPQPVAPDSCLSGYCWTLARPVAGKALVLTSIHITVYFLTAVGGASYVSIFRSPDGTCNYGTGDQVYDVVSPGSIGEIVLPFDLPGGLPVPAGMAVCLQVGDTTTLAVQVSAFGFTVSAASVPATAAAGPKGAALLKQHR